MAAAMGPGFFSQPLDLVVLALFAFLVLGPKRFPELTRSAGRLLRDTRAAFSSPEARHLQAHAEERGASVDTTAVAAHPPPGSRHLDLDAID
jgi:Sec-independent protein translocase protein TatA